MRSAKLFNSFNFPGKMTSYINIFGMQNKVTSNSVLPYEWRSFEAFSNLQHSNDMSPVVPWMHISFQDHHSSLYPNPPHLLHHPTMQMSTSM